MKNDNTGRRYRFLGEFETFEQICRYQLKVQELLDETIDKGEDD